MPSPERNQPPAINPYETYLVRFHDWRARIEAFEEDQWRQVELGTWLPSGFSASHPTVALFGGGSQGWDAILTVVGAGMLGLGRSLEVVNLSGRRIGDQLIQLADMIGYPVTVDRLAATDSTLDLFDHATVEELIDFVLAILQPVYGAGAQSEAMADRDVLRATIGQLVPPVNLRRLNQSLLVILRETDGLDGSELSADEKARLLELYGPEVRDKSDVIGRVHRLQREIKNLIPYSPERSSQSGDQQRAGGKLHFIDLMKASELDFKLMAAVTVQAIIRWMDASGGPDHRVFVIAGADAIKRPDLERLATAAATGKARLVLLFERLREDSVDMLGAEGAGFAFMRLTDHREATVASEFIGRRHRFVLAQSSVARSQSYGTAAGAQASTAKGENQATTYGTGGFTVNAGTSVQVTQGRSSELTVTEGLTLTETQQRVYEFLLEPHEIQHLPETGVFLVEPQREAVRLLDCDPAIVVGGERMSNRAYVVTDVSVVRSSKPYPPTQCPPGARLAQTTYEPYGHPPVWTAQTRYERNRNEAGEETLHYSDDRRWWWSGQAWLPISDDGHWRWDGERWVYMRKGLHAGGWRKALRLHDDGLDR